MWTLTSSLARSQASVSSDAFFCVEKEAVDAKMTDLLRLCLSWEKSSVNKDVNATAAAKVEAENVLPEKKPRAKNHTFKLEWKEKRLIGGVHSTEVGFLLHTQ